MTTAVNLSGNNDIDGILWGWRWDVTNLTWSTPFGTAEYAYTTINGFEAFNPAQTEAAALVLANVASFCNLTFTLTGNTGALLRFAQATSINYTDDDTQAGNTGLHNITTAEANPPENGFNGDPPFSATFAQGDSWFHLTSYDAPEPGTYAYTAGIMHETGHNLGLKHGQITQPGHGVGFPTLPADHDSLEYSVMTYRSYPGAPIPGGNNIVTPANNFPQTFMQNDIAALQYLYGANFNYNNGHTVYTWDSSTGWMSIDGIHNGNQPVQNIVFMTVWDGGGFDTYDFSNYTTNLNVDLNPGGWTTLDTSAAHLQRADLGNDGVGGAEYFARGNIANAQLFNGNLASLIECATGGSGNDAIYGNTADNILTGNVGGDYLVGAGGADVLFGGQGSDFLDGGAGIDWMYGGPDNDYYEVDNAADFVFEYANEGVDRYDSFISIDALSANVEDIVLYGDGNLYAIANDLANSINGTNGSNSLYGLGNGDYIYGYGGSDWIDGGAGDDYMVGGTGDDFYQYDSLGDYVVENFNEGVDRIDSHLSLSLQSFVNVENLVLYGTGNLNGTGNALDNAINGTNGDNSLDGLDGNDQLYGYGGNDYLYGGAGIDTLAGGDDNDAIYGGNDGDNITTGNGIVNYVEAGYGIDTVIGGTGSDIIYGGADVDYLNGADGNDTLSGDYGVDYLWGEAGIDLLYVDSMDGSVSGGADADYLVVADALVGVIIAASDIENWFGYNNADAFNATGANTLVYMHGYGGADNLTGGSVGDWLYGDDENDSLVGGEGDDVLVGGNGADAFFGGGDTDLLYVDHFDTEYNGGFGIDYLVVQDTVDGTYNIGTTGIEYAYGYTGNDTISAVGANVLIELHGGDGGDTLTGGSGVNLLLGENGADTLVAGGALTDHFVGGAGADIISEASNGGTDWFYDFQNGSDHINLHNTGLTSFAQVTINNTYAASNWYGVGYGTGTLWVNTGGVGALDSSDFLF